MMTKAELRKELRDKHLQVLERVKKDFHEMQFPVDFLNEKVMDIRKTESRHTLKGEEHHTSEYLYYQPKFDLFGFEWKYIYCHVCNKVIKQQGALIDQIDNTVYIKQFLNNKETIKTPEYVNFFGSSVIA